MDVILKKDIANLGSLGQTVRVAAGYARNYLIPQGIAFQATPGNMRQFEAEKEAHLKKALKLKESAEGVKAALEALSLSFSRKAAEEEKLFGSVTSHDIAEELLAKGFELDKKDILLEHPIKNLGEFTVSVRLHPEVAAEVKFSVVKES